MGSLPTAIADYRDTPEAEQSIEEYGVERVETLLRNGDTVAQDDGYFAAVHDGELGCVIRTTDEPVLERIYDDSYPNISEFELSYHAKSRAKERGFTNEEVLKLAQTGVQSVDEHGGEYGVVIFNRFWDNTVLVPTTTAGKIKSVFTRQGHNGGLVVDGRELNRSTRNYLQRKGVINENVKYYPNIS